MVCRSNVEQAIVNAIYAGIAWLAPAFGQLFREHGAQTFSVLVSQPQLAAGAIIAIACIARLPVKPGLAALEVDLELLLDISRQDCVLPRQIAGWYPSPFSTHLSNLSISISDKYRLSKSIAHQ